MRDLGFQSSQVEAILNDAHAAPIPRVRRDIALAQRLGVHWTPTFVLVIGHNPPVSANHRSLATILNAPAVQALFAARARTRRTATIALPSQQADSTGGITSLNPAGCLGRKVWVRRSWTKQKWPFIERPLRF
jgi:hypothetical protein